MSGPIIDSAAMSDEDRMIALSRAGGMSVPQMARALRRTERHIYKRIAHLGLSLPKQPRRSARPLDAALGEKWRDRADLGIRVSDHGRFMSLKTGRAICVSTSNGRDFVTVRVGPGRKSTRTVHILLAETFGLPDPAKSKPYTPDEDAALRACRTFGEAYRALPGRSPGGIKMRARKIGHELERGTKVAGATAPWSEPLYREAAAAVPRGLPSHLRDDLISDMIVMRLEGFAGSMAEAFKAARRAHDRLIGAYKERSAFDFVGGSSTVRLIDTFEAGSSL